MYTAFLKCSLAWKRPHESTTQRTTPLTGSDAPMNSLLLQWMGDLRTPLHPLVAVAHGYHHGVDAPAPAVLLMMMFSDDSSDGKTDLPLMLCTHRNWNLNPSTLRAWMSHPKCSCDSSVFCLCSILLSFAHSHHPLHAWLSFVRPFPKVSPVWFSCFSKVFVGVSLCSLWGSRAGPCHFHLLFHHKGRCEALWDCGCDYGLYKSTWHWCCEKSDCLDSDELEVRWQCNKFWTTKSSSVLLQPTFHSY